MKRILSFIKLKLRNLLRIQSPSLYLSRYNKMFRKWAEEGMNSVDEIWLASEEEMPKQNENIHFEYKFQKFKRKVAESERPNRIMINEYQFENRNQEQKEETKDDDYYKN